LADAPMGEVNKMPSIFETDEQGLVICPQCGKHYVPDFPIREPEDDRLIQVIYPKATAEQREQLLTGLCSDTCWNLYLGASDEPEELEVK
jgi:hypothetical protein